MAAIPRSIFNNASTLFTSGNNSSIMNANVTNRHGPCYMLHSPATPDPVAVIHETTTDEQSWI